MEGPTDHEMIAIGRHFVPHGSPEEGDRHAMAHGSHMGKHRGWPGGRGRGEMGLIVVSVGRNRQGRVSGLRIGELKSCLRALGGQGLSLVIDTWPWTSRADG